MLLFVPIDDGCEDAGQVAVRLDLVQLTGLNERREHGPILCASIVTSEERVLSLQGNRPDRAFLPLPGSRNVVSIRGGIVVHLDAAVDQKEDQAIPVFGDVFERRACWGFSRDLCSCVIKSDFEGCYLGR